ncbi:hypothetical protein BDZ89DRAFT_1072060 [Hymenopellis radicata]|nr:hypothetical protein BDZ89DRAFT_1072060 [Hymenopellis radicata]
MNSLPALPSSSSSSFSDNDNSLALSAPHGIVPVSYSLDAQTYHIHTLPTEILLSVFSLLPPVTSSTLAASCYDLWRCITVTVFSAVWCPNSVGLLREVVSRSGEHPLHITFDMRGIDMTGEDFGHEIYNQDGKRILPFFEARSLQLLTVLMDFSPRWVSAEFRGSLPQLEALTIDCDDSVQVNIYAFCDAPRLRSPTFWNIRCPLRKLSLLLCQCDCLQLVDILRLTPTVEEIVIEFDNFFWYFDRVDLSSEDSDSDDDDDSDEYFADKAGRRLESGRRVGLESLMDFSPPIPLLSLPCLKKFCLSFNAFYEQSIALSLKVIART